MLDWLIDIDKQLLLLCNGTHFAWLDNFFWIISQKYFNVFIIIPLLIVLLRRREFVETLLVVLSIAVVVLICDQIASSICKPLFQRLRPSQDESLSVVLVNDYRGGRYGFISSHAANTFGAAVFMLQVFRNKFFTTAILLWAVLVSYSRIYLGVHFPGDVLCGMLVGIVVALLVFRLYEWLRHRLYVARRLSSSENVYHRDIYVDYFAAFIPLLFIGVGIASFFL